MSVCLLSIGLLVGFTVLYKSFFPHENENLLNLLRVSFKVFTTLH